MRARAPGDAICAELREGLGAELVTLHASGREALRVAVSHLARQSGRNEVIVPAYTCFSVPASIVAAGLSVRLVDVDASGRIDVGALEKLPLERAAAIVVSNLLGLAEPVGELLPVLTGFDVAVIDDAAQAIGARSAEGPVGGRGDVGVLSFGRGKPVSALGGGALAWKRVAGAPEGPPPAPTRRATAMVRAAAYALARLPWVFRALSAVPAFGIGETIYDPEFRQGAIDGASLCLAHALMPGLEAAARLRRSIAEPLAERLREQTDFVPLVGSSGVYPRLGLVAPSEAARNEALEALEDFGATRLYPSSLDELPALGPHRVGDGPCPGGRDFAARLLTLPTGSSLPERHWNEVASALARAS
jgi:dTDP-4-amino-4,6-dideoxygalactose transaminase